MNEESFIDWRESWIRQDPDTKEWFHFWPDDTMFGPFKTKKECLKYCSEQAPEYSDL